VQPGRVGYNPTFLLYVGYNPTFLLTCDIFPHIKNHRIHGVFGEFDACFALRFAIPFHPPKQHIFPPDARDALPSRVRRSHRFAPLYSALWLAPFLARLSIG
jgi:hypothetical protein